MGKVNCIRADGAYTRRSFSTVQLCLHCLGFFLPASAQPHGGHVAPQGWWEDHDPGSREALVLPPALSLSSPGVQLSAYPDSSASISLGIGHWGLFVCYFLEIGKEKYFCQTSAGPDSIRKRSFVASKVQSSKEFNGQSALCPLEGRQEVAGRTRPTSGQPFSGEGRPHTQWLLSGVRDREEHCPVV